MIGCFAYPNEIIIDIVEIMEAETSYQLTYEGTIYERVKK